MYQHHQLLSFRGHHGPLANPVERWAIGVRVGAATTVGGAAAAPADPPTQELVDDAKDAFLAMLATANMNFTTSTVLEEVRGYPIDRDGHITAEPTIANAGPTAGAGVVFQPYQLTVCCTLFTGGLGAGRFGRFYLPSQYTAVNSVGVISDGFRDNIATGVHTFLSAIRNSPGLGVLYDIIVASQTPTEGRNRNVAELRVGNVVDTQRRRRRSLVEVPKVLSFE